MEKQNPIRIPVPPADPILAHRDPALMLRSKMALWSGRKLKHEEVVYVLKAIGREILPAAQLDGSCPTIRWFTDWCLHHRLDRTRAGGEALIAVAEAIPLHDDRDPAHDNDWITGVANDGISFTHLRLELLAACRKFDLPDHLFLTWEGWRHFFVPLAEEISGRPVSVDEVKTLREKLQNTTIEGGRTLEEVTLVIATNIPSHPYWWSFTANDKTKILVPVWFGERELQSGPTPPGWVSPLG
jgi:hypothetical protein